MKNRFQNLVKIPIDPPAKMLSLANIRLDTPLDAPASATTEQVLVELEQKEAWFDILMLLAVLLPVRERIWWACLAARDYIGPKTDKDPLPLATSEAWVFEPSEENRDRARKSLDNAYVDDDTVHCATAVLYCDGTLGPGDLSQFPAPAGVTEASAFAMNMVALGQLSDRFEEYMQVLIERGLDIARGGKGNIVLNELMPELEGET
ncbi:MAG: hypothetical protein AB8B51_06675 [Sedimentitalea sp.]